MIKCLQIVPRSVAIDRGMMRYFTGRPCKHGHVSERRTSRGDCVTCYQSRLAEYRELNKDHISKANIKYKKENRDRYSQKYKEWLSKNKKRKYEYTRKWAEKNKDRRRFLLRRWQENNRDRVRYKNNERKARQRGADGSYSSEDIASMFSKQSGRCASCRKSIKAGYHIDHIEPISRGGSNYPSNLQLLCQTCNLSKGAKDPYDWANENGRLL